MKVSELIAKLKEYPGHWEVLTEGCDCWGDVGGVLTRKDQIEKGYDGYDYMGSEELLLMRPHYGHAKASR